jgi:uncharacterized protein (DUF362 family)
LGIQSKNKTVVIKINLCDARTPETGTITHPLFLDALLRFLRENYKNLKIFVAESDSTVVLADEFIKWFGFLPVLEKWNAKWINLSKEEIVNKKIKGLYLKEIQLPRILCENVYLISLAKLKTNLLTKISCSLKNQFGCLPEIEKNIYHSHINEVIADINLAIKPDFSLVDGITAMGGTQGPAFGTPVEAELIIGGKDPVAIDACCAKIMGFNPYFIPHIRKSNSQRIGHIRYDQVGDNPNIKKTNFEIKKWEMFIFRFGSSLKKKTMQRLRRGRKKR